MEKGIKTKSKIEEKHYLPDGRRVKVEEVGAKGYREGYFIGFDNSHALVTVPFKKNNEDKDIDLINYNGWFKIKKGQWIFVPVMRDIGRVDMSHFRENGLVKELIEEYKMEVAA